MRELARLFGKLGLIGFGGPAAHIALMRDEVVVRRRWLSDRDFLDLVGATNLIPGPNSTEMAIHIGRLRAGCRGLVVAGLSFIAPAAAIVLALAWTYVRYGDTPALEGVLYGIKPVMIAIVVQALIGLGRAAVRGPATAVVSAAAVAGFFLGVHELVLLFGGGAAVLAVRRGVSRGTPLMFATGLAVQAAEGVDLARLGWVFLKVGALLYGSGYVLLAFLERDLVQRLGWLTSSQLLDAVAIGQLTPGPVFTTATFVGYVLAGWAGAAVATLAIFVPSFLFVAVSGPLIPRIRRSPVASAVLDGVNAAAVGLMAAVTVELAGDAFVDPVTVAVGAGAAAALAVTSVNSVWLVAGGAVVGGLRAVLGG